MEGILFAVASQDRKGLQPNTNRVKCGFTTEATWTWTKHLLGKPQQSQIKKLLWVPSVRLGEAMLFSALAPFAIPDGQLGFSPSCVDVFIVSDRELHSACECVVAAFRQLAKCNCKLLNPYYMEEMYKRVKRADSHIKLDNRRDSILTDTSESSLATSSITSSSDCSRGALQLIDTLASSVDKVDLRQSGIDVTLIKSKLSKLIGILQEYSVSQQSMS